MDVLDLGGGLEARRSGGSLIEASASSQRINPDVFSLSGATLGTVLAKIGGVVGDDGLEGIGAADIYSNYILQKAIDFSASLILLPIQV